MKTMKSLIYILSILIGVGFTSCLNGGLEDLPVYQDAEITAFNFEYRYATPVGESGEKLQRRKAEKAVRDGLAADQR